jgi:hypothetical protein
MITITTRLGKGAPLTNSEVDTNFTNLRDGTVHIGAAVETTTIDATDLSSLDGGINVNDNFIVTAAGNITQTSGELSLSAETITGTGSNQGDAAAITSTYNIVNAGTLNTGIRLEVAKLGFIINVVNATAVNIKLYPATSGTINGGTVNTAISIPSGSSSQLVGVSATDWKTLVETVIYDESSVRLN